MSKPKNQVVLCLLILLVAVALFPNAANAGFFIGGNLNPPSSAVDSKPTLEADGSDPQPRPIPLPPRPPAGLAA